MSMQFAGDRSEPVNTAIERIARANDARVVKDVLIDLTVTTADYPYILVDQYGLLVVDVEEWPGGTIHGRSGDKRWRARFDGAPSQTFANPLTENARRIDVLLEALLAFGRRLPREHVSELAVFVGADIRPLSLTEAEKARTTDRAGLGATLQARYDFAINCGALDRDEIEGFVSVLKTINRFDTPEAQARHGLRLRSRTWLRLPWRKPKVEVGLANEVLGIAPVAPRLTGERYPGIAPAPPKRAPIGGIVALLAVVGLAVWLLLFGGYALVSERLVDLANRPAQAGAEVTVPEGSQAPTVSIAVAKQRLLEVSPEIYAAVVEIDAPQTMVSGGITAFTWQYIVAPKGGGSLKVYNVTLTIGADGRVRAMSTGQ